MEEKIIKSLIELYRDKGIDVTTLVSDPSFLSLSFETRVNMLKKYADEIARDSSDVVTQRDVKTFIKDTALGAGLGLAGGFIGAFNAGSVIENVNMGSMGRAIKRSAMLGGSLGAISGGIRALNNINARKDLHAQALQLKANPSDENAIKVISLRAMQPSNISRPNVMGNFYDKYNNKYMNHITKSYHKAGREVFDENEDKPLRPTSHAQSTKDKYYNDYE